MKLQTIVTLDSNGENQSIESNDGFSSQDQRSFISA